MTIISLLSSISESQGTFLTYYLEELLEENIDRTQSDINHSNIFFNPSPEIMAI